jgi:hypothetical protein
VRLDSCEAVWRPGLVWRLRVKQRLNTGQPKGWPVSVARWHATLVRSPDRAARSSFTLDHLATGTGPLAGVAGTGPPAALGVGAAVGLLEQGVSSEVAALIDGGTLQPVPANEGLTW